MPIKDGRMKGRFTLHVTPDLWVPRDYKGYKSVFEIDAKMIDSDKLSGQYKIVSTRLAGCKQRLWRSEWRLAAKVIFAVVTAGIRRLVRSRRATLSGYP